MSLLLELLITAALIIGASARITRLITADTITAPLRAAVTKLFRSDKASTFMTCPWCVGWWVALAATYTAWEINAYPLTGRGLAAGIALALGVSYLVGYLEERDD